MFRELNKRRFESLEKRDMLAADVVTAVVNHTNLTVTGDGNDDAFLVAGDGTAGDVVITGFTGSDGNGTQINGTQDGAPVTGTPNGSITLTGVTGNITLNLGAGNVTVSVADLTAGKNLSIAAGAGDDTIDVGTVAAITTPTTPAATNAVTVGGNLSIKVGGGTDAITVGETPTSGTDVTVSGSMSVTAGNGDDTIAELSLAVSRDASISAGSGDDSVTIGGATVAGSGVAIGRGLTVSLGGGDDTVTEASTSVSRTESMSVGSGDDSITLGVPAVSVSAAATNSAVHAAAVTSLLADGDVTIGRDLDVQMGTGDSSLSATNVQIGNTLLVTGGSSFGLGFGGGFGLGEFGEGFGGRLGGEIHAALGVVNGLLHHGGLFGSTATDTITLSGVTAEGAGIFTGFKMTDIVNIQGSTFDDLGVGLGTGSGSLSVGTTTTSHSTTLVGLGTGNVYNDLTGNSFTSLHTFGLTPTPTAAVSVVKAVASALKHH